MFGVLYAAPPPAWSWAPKAELRRPRRGEPPLPLLQKRLLRELAMPAYAPIHGLYVDRCSAYNKQYVPPYKA